MNSFSVRSLIAASVALAAITASTANAQTDEAARPVQVGIRPDGSAVLPTDQVIHPAGRLIRFHGHPNAIAIRPDKRTAAVAKMAGVGALTISGDGSKGPLLIFDLASGRVLQEYSPSGTVQGSFAGLAYSRDGTKLYASDPRGQIIVMSVAPDGQLSGNQKITLPIREPKEPVPSFSKDRTGLPDGLAISRDGRRLYVAMSMNNSLAIVDLESDAVTDEIPVGNAPHSIAIDGSFAFVTNQGGRVAMPSEATTPSAGTPVVVDPATGRPSSGTVSVIDLNSRKVLESIPVGMGPTAILLHQGMLFVANTNGDTISVIDPRNRHVIKTISIQPFPNAPFGSSPNSLIGLPDGRLIVSLGANNALAVYDWKGPQNPVSLLGLVPTAWYPATIALDDKRRRLVVAALKGLGAGEPAVVEPLYHRGFGRSVSQFVGAVSLVDLPSKRVLAKYTQTVIADNRWSLAPAMARSARAQVPPKPIPERLGEPSTIKHVFYIIKENLSYDQILGDEPRGNGDQTNLEFGRVITPNQHALVQQFPLLDNFYVSGTISYDGHNWTDAAFVTDYIEQAFVRQFRRGYYDDVLSLAPTGFIWENALRHGKKAQIFGEGVHYVEKVAPPQRKSSEGSRCAAPWKDWYHDSQVLEGKSNEALLITPGECQVRSHFSSVDALLYRNYPDTKTTIPDQYRVDMFLEEFRRHEAKGDLPDLTVMSLPMDHTVLMTPDCPTPRASVADNDLAVGRIVDAISHSSVWKDSAIFIVEDDASNGADHVDGHRSPIWVISPYARRGFVDHTYYTQIDVVRTIEQILGLPPMNQKDLVATPMHTVFADTPDLTPFTALPNEVPLDEMNPAQSASTVRNAWIRESIKLFVERPFKVDDIDENLAQRGLWYSAFDFTRPFPGDSRILFPSEVPRNPLRRDE